jgi:hypothetical protein
LRVALKAVSQAESLPSQSIKDSLAQVAERRMPKIMGVGRCLYYDMIKTAKITEQIVILGAQQLHCDRSGNRSDLDRMGQPIMHDAAGRRRGDNLGDVSQP